MYAETFNARPWLEEPAKWLRWAMQSLTSRNLDDVRYNLQQFWKTIAAAKAQAKTQQDWSEILTMDSQSQWTLGNLYQNEVSDVLKAISDIPKGYIGSDATIQILRDKVRGLNQSAVQAFAAQVKLAGQAAQAASAAGIKSQASNSLTVGTRAQAGAPVEAAFMNQQAANMSRSTVIDDLTKAMKTSLFGVPAWVWLAGGAAALLLITSAPAMAQAAVMRRAVRD